MLMGKFYVVGLKNWFNVTTPQFIRRGQFQVFRIL
jgi:hypothetical protein